MLRIEGYESRIRKGLQGWQPAVIGVASVFAGGAILGDGRVGLILDVAQIIQLGRTAGNDDVAPAADRRSVA